MKERFTEAIRESNGEAAAKAAIETIKKEITCYAAKLHLNKSANVLDREGNRPGRSTPRISKKGYAPIFETVTPFSGRSAQAAILPDLLGRSNPKTPWKHRLPRLIFVSDMGDAFSAKKDFAFLKSDLLREIGTMDGKRHLWLWLTKRPERMAEFADEIGGFPDNVCAMTTLTGPDDENFKRLAALKKVKAATRGLSIEPLWDRIPPAQLDLVGIDWVIVGGESGAGLDLTRPFALEWAEEIREHCRDHGVAFFLKQLGRNPSRHGKVFKLKDPHGGDWNEWEEKLRVREFPKSFFEYRKNEMVISSTPRPTKLKNNNRAKTKIKVTFSKEEKAEFKRQHNIIKRGAEAFFKVGQALASIKEGKLWKAGGYQTWKDYCNEVVGMSTAHAHRTIAAANCVAELRTLPRGNVLPATEAQVRPLLKLPKPEQRAEVWLDALQQSNGSQPSGPQITQLVAKANPSESSASQPGPPSISQRRATIVKQLREGIRRKSWDEIESLVIELEKLG
ncbi:phage Gp37/Gp68 family protein [Akkermansiaceae bacterium]|nr:phage Gp37/Gp68 family protein [Akkermansiaceae bacterium]